MRRFVEVKLLNLCLLLCVTKSKDSSRRSVPVGLVELVMRDQSRVRNILKMVFSLALPYLKKLNGPNSLIGDNLSSHMSLSHHCLQRKKHQIHLLATELNWLSATARRVFFGSLKREWRKMVSEYKNGHPNELVVKKDRFPQLLKILMERTQASLTVNLQNGLIKCLSHESVFCSKQI